jgi:hypothetical protein
MEQNFKNVKLKAEELGLTPEQIKAALKLFSYASIYKVEFYLKDNDGLGMRKKREPFEKPGGNNPFGDIINEMLKK